jgi:fumarate hydratase subunit alpha
VREVDARTITDTVRKIHLEASFNAPEDFLAAMKEGLSKERSPVGKKVLEELLANYDLAAREQAPMCQDTGTPLVFVEIGQDVHVKGGLTDAINEGVRQATKEGYLRASIVRNPFKRDNTGDNTPAPIHYDIVPGDKIHVMIAPKGGGSENMGAVKLMKPADGVAGVKKFVWDTVRAAGPNPCPPILVGVAVGGTMDQAALASKRALFRPIGEHNPDPELAKLEEELLEIVNATGVGPGGMGGTFTAAAVNVEALPCHIASMPAAVSILCNACRHREAVI